MKISILLLAVIGVLATLKPAEAAYKMSTYKGYTLVAWINPFNTYAKVINNYVNYIRTYYWKLWGLLHGQVIHHRVALPAIRRTYGDELPDLDELADMAKMADLPDMKFLDLDDLPDIHEKQRG